jgi:hypothetical protein
VVVEVPSSDDSAHIGDRVGVRSRGNPVPVCGD